MPVKTPGGRSFWLMKSEPEEFSIDALARVTSEPWTGVRNYQARNFMRDNMKPGDGILFYHSNCEIPGIVGLARVASEAYPDPTQFDPASEYFDPKASPEAPRWVLVDVAFDRKFADTISLQTLRDHADRLDDFALVRRGNRLSVLPVTAAQWDFILSLEPGTTDVSR
jgi:predicted RNA-binding protein with PUA-like domain